MTQNRLSSKSLHPSISLGKSISQHTVKVVAIFAALFGSAMLYSDTGSGMVTIPSGSYSPLYRSSVETEPVQVDSFLIDEHPVTNGEFLEFVTENPTWCRSQIKPIFADESYLCHWVGDLDLGQNAEKIKDLPAINVTWFASRAYARWKGKRLPTVAEWEFV
ncbi:MAG: formylglycine-generating enzyme family protein, partial [Opitutales bacterium]|nr:formylglycine-generating enzyme family protein [Opitutales bacterium]